VYSTPLKLREIAYLDSKVYLRMVSYDTIHKQLVHGSFIVGLREDINKHVTILNVATLNYIVLQFRLLKQDDYFWVDEN